MKQAKPYRGALAAVPLALALLAGAATASSHREAPFITTVPKVDATDFYMFRSYEAGRGDYVTMIANYQPLQDAYGGPNYFAMDPNALYEIHIDNDGDAHEDITLPVPLQEHAGRQRCRREPEHRRQVGERFRWSRPARWPASRTATCSCGESYTVQRGARRPPQPAMRQSVTNAANGSARFDKPVDNIGTKTIPDYAGYAAQHIYSVNIPGCGMPARLFVGQRQDPFAVNLGTIFDLVNAPVGVITDPALIGAAPNTIGRQERHHAGARSAQELPDQRRRRHRRLDHRQPAPGAAAQPASPASGHQASEKPGGAWVQVSRLGMPLVNEVVIGLKDKDKFNASQAQGRRPVRRLRHQPDAAGAAGDRAGAAQHGADQLPAQRPGDDLPDRHPGRQPAAQRRRRRRCCG